MNRSYVRAFSTLGCPNATLEQAFSLARKYGIPAIELRALGGTIDLPDYFLSLGLTPKTLAKMVRESGIRVVALDTNLRLITCTEEERESFLLSVPWAEALGVPLRVFDGGKRGDPEGLTRAVKTARWWKELRAERGWRTYPLLESHDAFTDGAALLRFAQAAPEIPILWDTHNTWKESGENPIETWRMIGNYVRHLHVRDSVSVPRAEEPFTLVLPGTGEFPMAELLKEMNGNFEGVISLEWEKHWSPYIPPLDEALSMAEAKHWW